MKSMKRTKKVKNALLCTVTAVMAVILTVSVSCLDTTGTCLFAVSAVVSGGWITLFLYANRDIFFADPH